MQLLDRKTHELIDLIYEAAVAPEMWPELLNAMAELVDTAPPGDATISGNTSIPEEVNDNDLPSSLSDTLKNLPAGLPEPSFAVSSYEVLNQALSRHFVRALNVARRLSELEEHSLAVGAFLDQLPVSLILVNGECEIIECNRQAQALFDQNLPLVNRQGYLHIKDSGQGKKLKAVLKRIVSGCHFNADKPSFLLKAEREVDDLVVVLSPIRYPNAELSPLVAMFVSQRKSQPVSLPASVVSLYGLTDRESAVTEQLIHGYNVSEIADTSGVSEHTVRSQIKSILSKTGTRRQTELVSLVLTGPGSLMHMGMSSVVADGDALNPAVSRHLELSDGRILAYQEYGDSRGTPLLFFHSALGSRLETAINGHELASERGVRLVVPDRPGFGESGANTDFSFCNWVDDVRQLADHLRVDKFSVAGYAIGGVFALACAQAIPERVSRLALISSGVSLKTRADFENTIPLYRMSLKLARDLPSVHVMLISLIRRSLLQNPERYFALLANKLGEADAEIFANSVFKKQYYAAITECARQGPNAHAKEVQMLMQPWGFEPADVTAPCHLWHGAQDRHVPVDTGARLANQLPDVTEHYLEGEGHFLFYRHWGAILDELEN